MLDAFGRFFALGGKLPSLPSPPPLATPPRPTSAGLGIEARARSGFPSLDVSGLPEVWWYVDDETSTSDAADSRKRYRECGFMEPESALLARVDAFVDALRARPERVIAVFGHSDFFNFLMERHCGVSDYWLENAEVYRATLPAAAPPSSGAATGEGDRV